MIFIEGTAPDCEIACNSGSDAILVERTWVAPITRACRMSSFPLRTFGV